MEVLTPAVLYKSLFCQSTGFPLEMTNFVFCLIKMDPVFSFKMNKTLKKYWKMEKKDWKSERILSIREIGKAFSNYGKVRDFRTDWKSKTEFYQSGRICTSVQFRP